MHPTEDEGEDALSTTEPERADEEACDTRVTRDAALGYAPRITDLPTSIDHSGTAAMADEDQLSLLAHSDASNTAAPGSPSLRSDALSSSRSSNGEVEGASAVLDFAAFYGESCQRLSRGLVFLFRGDVDHAEDIAQQAFETAFRHWDQICASVKNPYGYVYKIAWRLAVGFREAQRRDVERAREFTRATQGDRTAAADPDERLDLYRAIRQLPDHERTVVGLSLIMGSGPKGIAEVLGLPEGTVRAQLKRGRDRLVKIIGEMEAGRS